MLVETCERSLSYMFAWLPSAVEKPSLLPAMVHSVLMKRGLLSLRSLERVYLKPRLSQHTVGLPTLRTGVNSRVL